MGAHGRGASKVPLNPVVPPACISAEGRKRFADPAGTHASVGAAVTQWCLRHHRDTAKLRRRMLASEHRERPRRDRSCRRSGIPSAMLQAPSTTLLIVPFQAPPYTRLLARSAFGGGNGGPQVSRQSPPSVRPQSSGPTAVGACHAPCIDGPPSSRRRARWAAPTTPFPPISFPPLEPPFPDPPFQLEHAKGGKPQGATARRLLPARLKTPR